MIQKKPNVEQLDLRTFYHPLTGTVWACVISVSIIVAIAKLLSDKHGRNGLKIAWASFATNFGGNFDHGGSNEITYKLVTFVALFCGNIIWMGYQASFTVELSTPIEKLPFNNLETFLHSGWNMYTFMKGG